MMKKESVTKPEMKMIGLSVRTNNKNEMNPQQAKISGLAGNYFIYDSAVKIPNRKNPGLTFVVYTEYASDEHGDYTYFIGEEVTSFENLPPDFKSLTIPASRYQKLTTPSGQMPQVVIDAWQQIWKMTDKDFGGKRTYQADFEVYGPNASDPANTSVDIYIGIK